MDEVAVLVDTVKGNTLRIGNAIAEELGVKVGDIKRPVPGSGILFLGSGVYGSRPGYYMNRLLRDGTFAGRKVALFATCAVVKDGEMMIGGMAETLEKKGAKILKTRESRGLVIMVHYRHPHEEDLGRARKWAREIVGK